MKTFTRLTLVGLGFAAASFASAQVSEYDFFFNQFNTQTANNAAASGTPFIQQNARVFSSNAYPLDQTDFAQVTAGGNIVNDWGNFNGTLGTDGIQATHNNGGAGYASEGDLESDFPEGLYQYYVTDTMGNVSSATMFVPAPAYADNAPYFTGNSFNNAKNAVAGNDLTFTWNQFTNTTDPTATLQTFFAVYDYNTHQNVFSFNGNGNPTSETISANLLTAGDTYNVNLYFSSRYYGTGYNESGDFVGAQSLVGFDKSIGFDFTVAAVPEPMPIVLLGLGAGALLLRRRS